jgi:hypothetical protein
MAANGLLYSSIDQPAGSSGFSGNVFSVGPTAGSEQTYPAQSLVMAPISGNLPDGKLFGTVFNYSNNTAGLATVDLQGLVTQFYQFPSTDRSDSFGVPIRGVDGNYYGVALPVGGNAYLYRVTPAGSATTVATLPFVETFFAGSGLVLQGSDGNFYGVQSPDLGCPGNQHGGVYKLTPSGQYTLLHQFSICGANGAVNSLIEASDGQLYGALQGPNVLFRLSKTGEYQELSRSTNGITQGLCICKLVQASDGLIYGTAAGGGPKGYGLIFALDAGLAIPEPRALEFHPKSGAAGTRVRIWGYNLLQASVDFNGVLATDVHNSGPNYVWATVPAGAASGPITVTTPGGISTTPSNFTVE